MDHRKELQGIVTEVRGRLRDQGVDISLAAVSKRIKVGTNIETMRYWIEAIRKRKASERAAEEEINSIRKEATQ